MNDTHIKTLAQVPAFLEGTHADTFSLQTKTERYGFIHFWGQSKTVIYGHFTRTPNLEMAINDGFTLTPCTAN